MRLRVEDVGNTAAEQGAALGGADFSRLNHAELPEGREDAIEVNGEYSPGDGIKITPVGNQGASCTLTLHEGPLDILDAQLCEEPEPPESTGLEIAWVGDVEVRANARRLGEIVKRN